jgi:hypothetical protein
MNSGIGNDLDAVAELVMVAAGANKWFATTNCTAVNVFDPFRSGVSTSFVLGAAATTLPYNSCILVKKQVPTLSRKRQGRNFYPGLQQAGVTVDGFLTSGYRNDLQANFNGFYAAVNAIAEVDTIIQFTAPASIGGDRTYERVTGFTVADKIATLRRRIRK